MPKNNIYPKKVPYDGNSNSPILAIGEAPGEVEYEQGRPLVGESGQLFNRCLEHNGIRRSDVKCGNVSLYRPLHNKFDLLFNTEQLLESIRYLYKYIENHKEKINVIAAMGNVALRMLTGRQGIFKWRGSILPYINDKEIKVIPLIHPAAVYRMRKLYPTFNFDMNRVVHDSHFKEFRIPERELVVPENDIEATDCVHELIKADALTSDIEAVKSSRKIICVGFSPSSKLGISFPWSYKRHIETVLNARNKKVFQNGTYDTIMLGLNGLGFNESERTKLLKRYYHWDTMVAQHVMNPELPKALAFLCSIHTRQPYYKQSGREQLPDENEEKGWSSKQLKDEKIKGICEYNGMDTCITYEVYEEQLEEMNEEDPETIETFDWEMEMLEIADHISQAGLLRDDERRNFIYGILNREINKHQTYLNVLGGHVPTKKNPHINVKSFKQMKELLYDKLGLPARRTGGKVTTNEDALISLIALTKGNYEKLKDEDKKKEWEIKMRVCELTLKIRGWRQLRQFLDAIPNEDNRIRGTVKVTGTETGRFSISKFVDGTGQNLHTVPRDPLEYFDEIS